MDKAAHRNLHVKAHAYVHDFHIWKHAHHVCACLLGGAAALIIWSLFLHKAAPTLPSTEQTARLIPQDWISVAQRVSRDHLFGQTPDAAIAVATANPANISVQGLIYSDDKDSALAILTVDGNSAFFRIGDKLPDGETLLAIAASAIQLGNGGVTRVIELQQDFGDGAGIGLAGDAGLIARQPNSFPGAAVATYAPALRPVAITSNTDPLAQLQSLRQQLIPQNPAASTPPPSKRAKQP